MSARQRIEMLADADSFQEWDAEIRTANPLGFAEPSGSYDAKIAKTIARSGEQESLVTGRMTISGYGVAITVADFSFLGASMGSVFGEKLARAVERAARGAAAAPDGLRLRRRPHARGPLLADADGEDDRRAAAARRCARAVYLAADRSMLRRRHAPATRWSADVILAEPGALIGFAGPRVIEQITKQKLPDGLPDAPSSCSSTA